MLSSYLCIRHVNLPKEFVWMKYQILSLAIFSFTETINLPSADYGFYCNNTPRKDEFKVGGF